jgi:hypothetical protein
MKAPVARGLSTDELIMLSGVQLLIFAVVYVLPRLGVPQAILLIMATPSCGF